MNIWNELPTPFLILAPMEGVTDLPFRRVVAKAGRPDLFFTEFTNVSSYASEKGRANALERLQITNTDKPIIAQIWGKNPDHFSELSQALASLGFSGIDLNFGCPDRHVNAAGGGAAMIRTPDLAVACLRAAQNSSHGLPVSVKTRLGYSKPEEFRTWLPILLNEHPVALTIHLRTKKEMSKVPAHYEFIDEIVALRDQLSPKTKLVVNGDIKDRAAALALHAAHPAVDGFMIGRGIFQNPYCFTAHTPTQPELLELLEYHLDCADEVLFERLSCNETRQRLSNSTSLAHYNYEPLKHYFKIYINNFPGASDLRAKLMDTHSIPEARAVLADFKNSQN